MATSAPMATWSSAFSRSWLLICAVVAAAGYIYMQRIGRACCVSLIDEYEFLPDLEPDQSWLFGPGFVDKGSTGAAAYIPAHLLALCTTGAVFTCISRLLQYKAPQLRPAFLVVAGVAWLLAVQQGSAQSVAATLALLIAGYVVAKAAAATRHCLPLVWAWHCCVLLRLCSHVPSAAASLGTWTVWYGSSYTMMRMISFAADYHWSLIKRPSSRLARSVVSDDQPPAAGLDYKTRAELWLSTPSYNLTNYLAYCLYPPLYVTGPVCSFNAFASQLAAPPSSLTAATVGMYGLRVGVVYLGTEWFSRMFCFQAVGRHHLWSLMQQSLGRPLMPVEVGAACWLWFGAYGFAAMFMWRFARFWALADGIDVPEDVLQCPVLCHHGVRDYWRKWHASFTVWCVRYVFVPVASAVGTSKSGPANLAGVWCAFAFSGGWHAMHTIRGAKFQLNYLLWGSLVAAYLSLEQQLMSWGRRLPSNKQGWLFQQCAAAAGAAAFVLILVLGGVFLGGTVVRSEHDTTGLTAATLLSPFILFHAFCVANVVQAWRRWRAIM